MNADLLIVADAVVTALRGHTFSAPFNTTLNAARYYVPVFALAGLQSLQVPVVPRTVTTTVATRGRLQEIEMGIDVGIMQQVADLTPAVCDPLMGLVQEVSDFLLTTPLSTAVGQFKPSAVGLANTPIFDPDNLDAARVFQSVISITYKGYR